MGLGTSHDRRAGRWPWKSVQVYCSELQFAAFCQHANCPISKAVSSCLLRESSTARLATVFIICALVIPLYIMVGSAFWFAIMSVENADSGLLVTVASFFRSVAFKFCIIVVFFLFSSLAVALNGFSYKSAAAILAAAICFGGIFAAIC